MYHLLTNEGCVLVALFIHFIFLVFVATQLYASCLLVLQIKGGGLLRRSRLLRGSRLLGFLSWSWIVRFLRLLRWSKLFGWGGLLSSSRVFIQNIRIFMEGGRIFIPTNSVPVPKGDTHSVVEEHVKIWGRRRFMAKITHT